MTTQSLSAHTFARRFHAQHTALSAAVEARADSRFFSEDELASEIARCLRPWRDLGDAERRLTAEHGPNRVISMAVRYERCRRSAFPLGMEQVA
jgi:hypothetical protein